MPTYDQTQTREFVEDIADASAVTCVSCNHVWSQLRNMSNVHCRFQSNLMSVNRPMNSTPHNDPYGNGAGPRSVTRPHKAWRTRWHIVDRAIAACTPKARRARCPPMLKPEKSKPQSIFCAKRMLEMDSATLETGDSVYILWATRANFDGCSLFLSGALCSAQVHHSCALTERPVFIPQQAGIICIRIPSPCWSPEECTDVSKWGNAPAVGYFELRVVRACSWREPEWRACLISFVRFLSLPQIRWEKNITLGEPPGFLHSWWW